MTLVVKEQVCGFYLFVYFLQRFLKTMKNSSREMRQLYSYAANESTFGLIKRSLLSHLNIKQSKVSQFTPNN